MTGLDNLTHALSAVAMSRAGFDRYGVPATTWLLVLGANAPDIDGFAGIGSVVRYLEWHRGITHSLLAAPVMAAIVVGVVWLCHRRVKEKLWPAFLLALVGVLSHLLLDYMTPYGIRLLLPFSGRWLALGCSPVIDFWLIPALLAFLVLPYLFRLVSDEIGARRGSTRPGAIMALVFFVAWGILRDFTHRRAVSILDSHIYHGLEPRRLSAYPDMTSPFLWHGVIDTTETFELADVNMLSEFDPTRTRTYYPPEPSPALEVARKTHTAKVFLDFADYPYVYVEQKEGGYEVVFRDLRYEYGTLVRRGAVARVLLDEHYRVLEEGFHFLDDRPVR